ncbi:MAG: alcohol dehydrogenase catalytic domain-containing protein [Gemmatimonadetes bacterium]|nr:alcohol dehydrogenase catalytic domain-containing protein [Gemmatimonadota bacterium]
MTPPAPEIPASMLVARTHGWGDVCVEEEPVPEPGPGEVLVRIEASGVCGSDALRWYVERKAPVVLGHEPAGTVAALGPRVRSLRAGDRVFVHHHAPCRRCAECRRGNWSACATWREPGLSPGAFAQYAVAREPVVLHDTLLLPDDLGFEAASFVEPLACCVRALHRHGRAAHGDAVHVIGLGAMGLLFVQLARAAGASLVTASDFLAERRLLARELGTDIAWDPGTEDVAALLLAETGGRGADVVIVCPGDARAVDAGLACAAPGGRVVLFTPIPPDQRIHVDQSALYFREVTIANSYSSGPEETRDALTLIADGIVRTEPLVTHRCDLAGVGEAIQRAASKGEGIKTIVYPHGLPDRLRPDP